METIKVNMNPNPLDVQTIHASQNDTEARQWEFELHNNGELIDTSDVKEQLVFKAYKGGTEQILPENGSVPTTAPFKGDIKYPDATRTDQEFIYRQSPTQSDGNAKIQAIYGNTLKWNQLMRNGNFADTSNWSAYSASYSSISANNNVLTQTLSGTVTGSTFQYGVSQNNVFNDASHKYLICLTVAPSFTTDFRVELGGSAKIMSETVNANATKTITGIVTPATYNKNFLVYPQSGALQTDVSGQTIQYRNVMLIDLTAMGLASLTNDEIFQWFSLNYPLPYYQYDSGSLLPFRGEGLKTVGKNQLNPSVLNNSTSSTLSLPISTYFPTGMKDAPDGNGGKIYDELTNSKAITRVGSRAYQSGDESDTSVITDGTTTYYALATPTETSFTTASLVTENAEIPLSNNDGTLIGKCTEQLSENPGFIDAKIKLADADGECYSNKIQLHIERSPQ